MDSVFFACNRFVGKWGGVGDQTSSNRGAWTFSLGQFFDQVGKRLIVINFGLQKYEANALGLVKSWGSIRKGWWFFWKGTGSFPAGTEKKFQLGGKDDDLAFTTCMNVMCKVGKVKKHEQWSKISISDCNSAQNLFIWVFWTQGCIQFTWFHVVVELFELLRSKGPYSPC